MEQMGKIFERTRDNKWMIKGNIKSDIIIFQQTMLTEMIDTTYISKEKDIDAQNISK